MPDEHARGLEQRRRQPGAFREGAHQDEERDHGQRVVSELVVGIGLHVGEERSPPGQVDVADGAGDQHGEADRHPDADQQQHDHEAEDGGSRAAHERLLRSWRAVSTAVSRRQGADHG